MQADTGHEEQEIQRIRQERVDRLEDEAFAAELDAKQTRHVLSVLAPKDQRPGLAGQVDAVVRRAEAARRRADAAHELAGTSVADYDSRPDRTELVRSRLRELRNTLIQEKEWAAHPDVYIDNPDMTAQWVAERRWAIAEIEAGIEAVEEILRGREADPAE